MSVWYFAHFGACHGRRRRPSNGFHRLLAKPASPLSGFAPLCSSKTSSCFSAMPRKIQDQTKKLSQFLEEAAGPVSFGGRFNASMQQWPDGAPAALIWIMIADEF